MYQRGIVHLLPLLLLAIAVVVVGFLVLTGKIKLPGLSLEKGPTVKVKTEYANPFKKETQYVNPFETYKNPFVVNR